MKKRMSIVVGATLLLLVVSLGNLFAEETFIEDFGAKYLFEFTGEGVDSSNGLELSAMFNLTPTPNKSKFYLGGFIDILSAKIDTDVVVGNTKVPFEGELSTVVLGVSFLYKEKPKSKNTRWYWGGGIGYYINNLKISPHSQNDIIKAYWNECAGLGFIVRSYHNDIMVENGMGFHLETGIKIALSPKIDFDISYRRNFVKMDMISSENAIVFDGVFNYLLTGESKTQIERGGMITVGISVWF